jgi:hypothetical protein
MPTQDFVDPFLDQVIRHLAINDDPFARAVARPMQEASATGHGADKFIAD